ncbi:MAG: hypothetical protein AB7E61_06765 [Acholeplasmataceae bacterium]
MLILLLRFLGFALLMGVPAFFIKLNALKKTTKRDGFQLEIILFAIFIFVLVLLQYIQLLVPSIRLFPVIAIIWLSFYVFVEPFIVYLLLYEKTKVFNVHYKEYLFLTIPWMFLFDVSGVVLMMFGILFFQDIFPMT